MHASGAGSRRPWTSRIAPRHDGAAGVSPYFPDEPAQDAEYSRAATTILCDCGCHPQAVHDCACGRAAEMRGEIAASIRNGKSGEEVIAAFVAQHGEQIRVAPTAAGFN